jgi:nucleotide-binding universal stress UspA family protein
MDAEAEMSNVATALPQALLVGMDFSQSAVRALDLALKWYPDADVTVLHVIDTEFAAQVAATGLGTREDVVAKLRTRAGEEFAWLTQEKGAERFDSMVVEGVPMVEVVKIAKDLEADLLLLGSPRAGADAGASAGARIDELLFGSTAEKVLRACPCPVLCVP